MRRLFFSWLMLFFVPSAAAEFADIQRIYHETPRLDQFEVCHGNGCNKFSQLALSELDWQRVSLVFLDAALTAKAERQKVSEAIGLLEEIVGREIGTNADLAGTFNSGAGQQDCNDESINTTTYMRLLKQEGYIRFHEIEDLTRRNFFFNGWPHTTAVIRETETGEKFAVDAWFFDNGHPATIVPLKRWKDNYSPADSPIGKPR